MYTLIRNYKKHELQAKKLLQASILDLQFRNFQFFQYFKNKKIENLPIQSSKLHNYLR